MSVLITGGAGYIGSHMAHHLVGTSEKIVVLDNLVTGVEANVPRGIDFVRGDIADSALVGALIGQARHRLGDPLCRIGGGAGFGVHAAGLLCQQHLGRAHADRDKCPPQSGKLHLLVHRRGLWHTQGPAGFRRQPHHTGHPYGRSKLMTEWILQDTAAAHPLKFGILRYFNVAGADPEGRTGQSTPRATHLIQARLSGRDRAGLAPHHLRHRL